VVHITAIATLTGWIIAGLAWQPALIIAITVLIITCPCALGLAIPAVQVVASGALFKAPCPAASPAMRWSGSPRPTPSSSTRPAPSPCPSPALDRPAGLSDEAFALAGRLALSSHHPLARALAAAVPGGRPLDEATEEAGRGVRAVVDGVEVRLGSLAFCDAATEGAAVAAAHPDASLIAFRHGDLAHVFAVRQVLRPDAVAVVAALRKAGLAMEILSGDRPEAVATVADALGIAAAGGMKPADKIARLDALKAEGRRVLMVGDGLNDAPALARAHVSMSPITAVHLTQAAADAVFLGDRLAPVAHALAVSRTALRLMKENLWIAVIYNAVAVPIAIAGWVTPLIAALAMSGSSVIVTANALRARRGRL
jgi:Cu2+-exporting ATPase